MHQLPEALLRSVVTLAGDAIIAVDASQSVVVFNRAAERLFERTASEMLGSSLDMVLPERYWEAHRAHIWGFMEGGEQFRFMGERVEVVGLRNGIEFPAEATISRHHVSGGVFMIAVVRDIGLRKAQQHALQVALDDRDLMLKELRHRIKNNLQIISSLVQLHVNRSKSFEARTELNDLGSRIQTLHLMYQAIGGTIDQVLAAAYVRTIAQHLSAFFAEPQQRVEILVEADENIVLTSRQATYVGMIVNESVTNSYKYAFPGGRPGEIRIGFHQISPSDLELRLADDGIGCQEQERRGLGVQLIATMVKALGGHMNVQQDHGTRFEIKWKSEA